jgi:hypothetical protein
MVFDTFDVSDRGGQGRYQIRRAWDPSIGTPAGAGPDALRHCSAEFVFLVQLADLLIGVVDDVRHGKVLEEECKQLLLHP